MPNIKETQVFANQVENTKIFLIIALVINFLLQLLSSGGLIYLV